MPHPSTPTHRGEPFPIGVRQLRNVDVLEERRACSHHRQVFSGEAFQLLTIGAHKDFTAAALLDMTATVFKLLAETQAGFAFNFQDRGKLEAL